MQIKTSLLESLESVAIEADLVLHVIIWQDFWKDFPIRAQIKLTRYSSYKVVFELEFDSEYYIFKIRLYNNKSHGLSPPGGFASLLFDQVVP